ncbi:hypothetical protein Y900_004025 [Mycolicibacterium aromaticivorans JS19b1 = JCM 16368]|uniref:Uncharacterized protein n=1 Tax=Mycolicibacterium aromaticivorans JS19b1 = JCM 16368 TaxID=1440774 RepID=A0A064CH81_9MYCO|nr:hypothetical protein [Mycolicibacterium aromaticivorans]KDE98132.1 hypothetical protein Y900_004025 [Mycolicibacterium aromaticivorans JS19b1 = JCM 16368]
MTIDTLPSRPLSTDVATTRSRSIELTRAGWGLALLVAPRAVMETVHRIEVDTKSVVVARILGARHLTQALLSGWRPSPEVLAMGVWVDAVHAMTAVGLAAVDRSRARAGLTDAAAATVWAGAGYHDLSQRSATPPSHQRVRDRLARIVLGVVPGGAFLLSQVRADRNSSRR